jgi:hypothetical protein
LALAPLYRDLGEIPESGPVAASLDGGFALVSRLGQLLARYDRACRGGAVRGSDGRILWPAELSGQACP